jgi:hypothetical protein
MEFIATEEVIRDERNTVRRNIFAEGYSLPEVEGAETLEKRLKPSHSLVFMPLLIINNVFYDNLSAAPQN